MSVITNNSAQAKESFIRKYTLVSFFILAIAFAWIAGVVFILKIR